MCLDIRTDRKAGAKGFVLGRLTPEGRIDVAAPKAFQDAAEVCPIGFHLSWELAADLPEALDAMTAAGVNSIRLAGGRDLAAKAIDGMARIRELARRGGDRVEFLLAGGVNAQNVGQLVQRTGVTNAHAGTRVRIPPTPEGAIDAARVGELAEALKRATQTPGRPSRGDESPTQ